MLKVGLTGGIGSGKSTIAQIFGVLGVPVFNSDLEARSILENDPAVMKKVSNLFGDSIYVNGKPDRKKIADFVFADKGKLKELNQIVHPVVAEKFELFCGEHASAKYIIKEAAILIEIGDKSVDHMILVTSPEQQRIERVMKRDGVGEGSVRQRIKEQMSDEQKMGKADSVIINDGEHSLIESVLELDRRFRS